MKTMIAGLLLVLLSGTAGAMTSRERCELIAKLELEQCREQIEGGARRCGDAYISKLRHCERFYPATVRKPRHKTQEDDGDARPAAPASTPAPEN